MKTDETRWSHSTPWGDNGHSIQATASIEQIMKAAKLDWKVDKVPLFVHDGGKINDQVPGFYGLQRSDTKSVLDVVGNQYTPVQNKDAFKFFKSFVEAGKAKIETAGSLRGGRMVWAMANLNNAFTLPQKDKVEAFLLLASPHEQGKSFRLALVAKRVACSNMITALLKNSQLAFRMSHRLVFDDSMIKTAKDTLGLANDSFDSLAQTAAKLAKKKLSTAAQEQYLQHVIDGDAPADKEYRPSKATRLAMQALTHAPGFDLNQNTAWSCLNAITYTTDHLLGNSIDTRLARAWFGKTATLKQKALDMAINL